MRHAHIVQSSRDLKKHIAELEELSTTLHSGCAHSVENTGLYLK